MTMLIMSLPLFIQLSVCLGLLTLQQLRLLAVQRIDATSIKVAKVIDGSHSAYQYRAIKTMFKLGYKHRLFQHVRMSCVPDSSV